jgi:hypothetical protein
MIKVNITLYGAFRQLGVNKIILEIPSHSTCAILRESLIQYLHTSQIKISSDLVRASVFATDECVLPNSALITDNLSLAVLPPVCGG